MLATADGGGYVEVQCYTLVALATVLQRRGSVVPSVAARRGSQAFERQRARRAVSARQLARRL